MTTAVYANMLAAFEASRLDDERLRRVIEADDVSSALKMLGDYGFPSGDGTVDGFIIAATNELIAFVQENSSDESVKNALLAPFWYNNVKLAYKSRFADIPLDAYYRCEADAAKVAQNVYDDCDKFLVATLDKLDAAEEKRPQAIDLAITRAMYKYVLTCKVGGVRKLFRAEIDLKNILTAARMRRLKLADDGFIDGGKIKRATLEKALTEDFADCFANTPYAEYAERLEECGFSELWRFERDADEYLMLMTDKLCADISSYDPFLNYYVKTRIELKNVKTALVCLKTNARDEFYKRVPLA